MGVYDFDVCFTASGSDWLDIDPMCSSFHNIRERHHSYH